MKKATKPISQFAICINTDDSDLLTPRMIYRVLPDDGAAQSNCTRVIDNEGEDYLYPAKYFIPMAFPQTIERALLRISRQVTPGDACVQKQRNISTLKRKSKPSAA